MTSRERINAALKHTEPDRTPMFEYIMHSHIASAVLGRRYVEPQEDTKPWNDLVSEIGWEKTARKYAVDRVELAMRLGHDMMCVFNNPLPPGQDYHPGYINYQVILDNMEPGDDPEEVLQARIERYQNPPFHAPEEQYLCHVYIKEEMQKRGIDLPVIGPAIKHGVWTDVFLMQAMLLNPELTHEFYSLCTRSALEEVKALIKIGIDQIEVGGDFSGKRLIISPESYRKFIMPEVRKVARSAHEAGKYAINATDGNLWEVIDDYLAGCEVDGCLEIDSFAGMELKRLKKEYGNRFTLFGNMDCGGLLSFGTPEEIRKATIDCIEDGWGNGGHIFCCSNAVTGSVPMSNYLIMCNTYRENFNLPKLKF